MHQPRHNTPFLLENLGRHVLRCAAERRCLAVLGQILLGQAKVRQPNVPCRREMIDVWMELHTVHVEQDVLGLEVAVDYLLGMQVLNGQHQHGCVEPRPLFAEASFPLRHVIFACKIRKCRAWRCTKSSPPLM